MLPAYLCLALMAGCSDGPPSPQSAAQTADAKNTIEAAPSDWAALLAWAEARLQAQPPPAPLPPAPLLPEPRWPLIRLDDPPSFGAAQKVCMWAPRTTSGDALAELGPFRSDTPTATFHTRLVPAATADGKDALALVIGGFDVSREEVGSIELTAHVPFGRHLTLDWSKAGTLLVPVESHERPFTVSVLTDGLAEWSGPLRSLTVLTDGTPPGGVVVEVARVRFLPRKLSFPDPIGLKRVRIGHEIRSAIYMHCPAEIRFENIQLPANARIRTGVGHVTGAGDDSGAVTTFEITIAGGERDSRAVLTHQVSTAAGWTDLSASLVEWAGKNATLVLRCQSTSPDAVAVWGNPVVYEPTADPPILILYLIDTVAAEHIDFCGYGYPRATMPRLAAAASRGVLFDRAYSNSSRTIESIPDLMLSLPVEQHGVHHNSTPAPDGLVTLAEVLRAAGFATASFCTNVNAGPRQGMDQGFDTFVDKIGYYWTDYDRTIPLDEVLTWIAGHRDRPAFIYIHTAEPHAPYTPPAGFAGRFDPDYRGTVDGTYATFRRLRDPVAQQRDLEHVVALYDEELLYADARLGLFLDALQAQGLLDKVHCFVTSDHGEEFLQHGMWEHGLNLHNEQTRIPLVAFGPTFARGRRINAPVQIFDVLPTILEMFSLPAPYPLAGTSLLPLLRAGGGDDARAEALLAGLRARRIYGSNHNYRISRKLIEYYVIADGRWKLLYGLRQFPQHPGGPTSRFLLFDLQSDPFERRNLLGERQDVARALIQDLVSWRLSHPPYEAGPRGPTQIDREHMQQLQALGYVGGEPADDAADTDANKHDRP